MHSAGLKLTKLISTRLEDNLVGHRGDRLYVTPAPMFRGRESHAVTADWRANTPEHRGACKYEHRPITSMELTAS